jgi:hypothetical protein
LCHNALLPVLVLFFFLFFELLNSVNAGLNSPEAVSLRAFSTNFTNIKKLCKLWKSKNLFHMTKQGRVNGELQGHQEKTGLANPACKWKEIRDGSGGSLAAAGADFRRVWH